MCVKVTLFLFSDYKMTPCCSLRGSEGKVNSLIMVIRKISHTNCQQARAALPSDSLATVGLWVDLQITGGAARSFIFVPPSGTPPFARGIRNLSVYTPPASVSDVILKSWGESPHPPASDHRLAVCPSRSPPSLMWPEIHPEQQATNTGGMLRLKSIRDSGLFIFTSPFLFRRVSPAVTANRLEITLVCDPDLRLLRHWMNDLWSKWKLDHMC